MPVKTCPRCGHAVPEAANACPHCGRPWVTGESATSNIGQDAAMRMLLPVGRSPWAIIAGYLGLFSPLFLPAPFALITGILAVRDIKRNPKHHGMGRAIFGIVMGSIFTILLCIMIVAITFSSK